MVQNVIQIKSGTTTNVDISVKILKNIMRAKKIIFGIMLYAIAKMVNYLASIIEYSVLCVMKL